MNKEQEKEEKMFTVCCGIETFPNEEEGYICRKCGKTDCEVVGEFEGLPDKEII